MIFKSFEEEQKEMQLNMYKYILDGRQASFPPAFWTSEGTKETFKMFLLYYLHEVLGYPKDSIPYDKITKQVVYEGKLITPYNTLFKGRLECMFKEVFPEAYPYKMPIISDELWYGKGIHTGKTPLRDIFPKWYFEEYLGLNEDNVIGLLRVADDFEGDELIYRNIIKNRFKSLADCVSVAYPNKSVEKIKSSMKGRSTSRVALKKRRLKDKTIELREKIKMFQSDDNCYFTNTGCNIHKYRENGIEKLKIVNYDRKPTYREIEFIRYELLDSKSKSFYFNIDNYSNEVILEESIDKPMYIPLEAEVILSDIKTAPATNIKYPITISRHRESFLQLSVVNTCGKYINLDDMKTLRDELLPKDKSFAVFLPPRVETKIYDDHYNLFEI